MTQEFLNLLKDGIAINTKIMKTFGDLLIPLLRLKVLEVRKNRYFLKSSYCIGRVELTKEGYGFVIPLPKRSNKKDWLVEKRFLGSAQKGDIVLAKCLDQNTKKSKKINAKILSILDTKNASVLCYLEKYKLDCIAISIPNEIPYKIKASQKSLKMLPKSTILRLNPKNGEILEVLGSLEDPNIDEFLALSLYNRQEAFSINAELESQSFKEVRLKDFKERADFTHLPFCAIDPIGAKDHDDAIYFDVENSTLYVAIADVSYYVKEGSALDLDAKARAFSVYFPHKCVPMLPRILSEQLCSLQAGALRLAMVWKIRLHKRTKAVLNSEICEAVIKVKQKLSYEDVDKLLENGSNKHINKPLAPMLLALNEVAQTLRKKRLKIGFDFISEEKIMELDNNLLLKSIRDSKQSESHQLVEECMLLANIESAKLQTKENTKNDSTLKLGIYRVHAKPKQSDITDLFFELRLLNLWDKPAPKEQNFHSAILAVQKMAKKAKMESQVDKLIIKSMQQANYASLNIGHFGLGFNEYSHFTSPIRRYSDLILHRILKDKITLKQSAINDLPQICEALSQKEREVAKVEMDFKDRKFARFLKDKIAQSFMGVITNDYNPPLVSLRDSPLQGARVVILKGSGVKYQRVRVQIIDVNMATARVYGRILECYNDEKMDNYLRSKMQQKQLRLKNKAIAQSKRARRKQKHQKPKHKGRNV